MSPTPEIETARAWLDDADRDLFVKAAELDEVKARRARIIAALKALGDEIEAEVPPVPLPRPDWGHSPHLVPSPESSLHELLQRVRALRDRIAAPAPVDEDPVADEMPVAWPV